jgi:hypothetical protein
LEDHIRIDVMKGEYGTKGEDKCIQVFVGTLERKKWISRHRFRWRTSIKIYPD